ncbi:MAG: bifunctional UDP-N-acetylglucosamine diphosphorylase/glucosamine-1-phosphate N-acetyltransferase GlmU [Actinomycetota bacterium]
MGDLQVAGVVLAAGEGRRLKSDLPKVLHPAAGRPLVAHVVAALQPLDLARRVVVTSARRDEIAGALEEAGLADDLVYAIQDPPRGTADAVAIALEAAGDPALVLVVNGDTPLMRTETLERLLEAQRATGAAAAIVTAELDDPGGYGRVVRTAEGLVDRVVEDRDASGSERGLNEVNAGFYVFDALLLAQMLQKVDTSNAQNEYYLTDVVGVLRAEGHQVVAVIADGSEIGGVNDRAQLAAVERALRARATERWMAEGVTIIDPATTYIDAAVVIDRDATIRPFTFLEGATYIGGGASVGPQVRIVDSVVGPGAEVSSFSVVRGSEIGDGASVGPFASLRAGTRLARGARVGSFVETKQTTLGEGSKANHLAYLGDAEIGAGVNIGAGTITCNWDGREKHRTVIEDDAYIASDTMLVAPVRIGKRAATGAGSVVRDDVPDDALAVGVPARIIEGKGNRMSGRADADRPEEAADGTVEDADEADA